MSDCEKECVFNSNNECWFACKNKFYNQALEDLVKKCENAAFYQFGQHYVDIRDIKEFKKKLSK